MEIVEGIGTSDEHADTFLRWNNYGIEVHEDGLCQAYVIIDDPDTGEIPKMVAEGFDSPEAVIQYFQNTEGQKALAPTEGEVPIEEGMPPVEGEVSIEVTDAPAPVAEEPVPPVAEDASPVEGADAEADAEPAPAEDKEEKSEDKEEKSEDKDEDKDKKTDVKKSDDLGGEIEMNEAAGVDGQAIDKQNKIEEQKDNSVACSEGEPPEAPLMKSWAQMRADFDNAPHEYSHPITYYQPSAATVRQTKAHEKLFSDKGREYPVDTIEHDPREKHLTPSHVTHPKAIHKSIEFGSEIPSWEDIRNGYSFTRIPVEPVAQNPIAKTALPGQGDEQPAGVGQDAPEAMAPPMEDAPVEDALPAEDIRGDGANPIEDIDLEAIAAQLQMSPQDLVEILVQDGGVEAVMAALQGDMGALEAILAQGGAPEEMAAEDVPLPEEEEVQASDMGRVNPSPGDESNAPSLQ